jgi:hypothetical protein
MLTFIKNFEKFLPNLEDSKLESNYPICSLDIESLSTSIPIENLWISVEFFLKDSPAHKNFFCTYYETIHLLLHNNVSLIIILYQQLNGIPKGNPVAPVLATLY